MGQSNHVTYLSWWSYDDKVTQMILVRRKDWDHSFGALRHVIDRLFFDVYSLGAFEHPHVRFFANSKKTAARGATGFSPTFSPIFLATFVKVLILGHVRSGHQVRLSDHTLQTFYNPATAAVFEGRLWNFLNMIGSSVPTKCMSRIFDICDLRSGNFRDLPIISQWAKVKLPVLRFILSLYKWNRTM